jgi:hypothetical protein
VSKKKAEQTARPNRFIEQNNTINALENALLVKGGL